MTMTIEQKKKSIKQCDIHFLKGEQFKTNIISVVLRIPLTKQNTKKNYGQITKKEIYHKYIQQKMNMMKDVS